MLNTQSLEKFAITYNTIREIQPFKEGRYHREATRKATELFLPLDEDIIKHQSTSIYSKVYKYCLLSFSTLKSNNLIIRVGEGYVLNDEECNKYFDILANV